MLKAGAAQVFYIEVLDDHLKQAFDSFLEIAPPSCPVVCESPALRNHITPGLFFIVDKESNNNKKTVILQWKKKADKWIDTGTEKIETAVSEISLIDNEWKLLKN